MASRLGNLGINPWCEVDAATSMRNRVLEQMRNNGTISDISYREASVAPLGLVPPPAGHRCA
jgi:membrane peptidoglycan carboxypeptidase